MDSPELFVAFGAVMLVIALLGVAIDWFGKPMRHRKFVPKIYRFPDERQPRRSKVRETEWSDTAFVLPVAEPTLDELLVRYPDAAGPDEPRSDIAELAPVSDHGPPTTQVPGLGFGSEEATPVVDTNPLADIVTLEDQLGEGAADALLFAEGRTTGQDPAAPGQQTDDPADDDAPDPADELVDLAEQDAPDPADEDAPDPADELVDLADENPADELVDLADESPAEPADEKPVDPSRAGGHPPPRKTGWRPGEYVFNLTPSGEEPTAATVRNRYWKNVAATAGASLFGETNISRMTAGKAPERRNPRTQKLEGMRLPHSTYDDTGGETPIPEWPTSELDPFAD